MIRPFAGSLDPGAAADPRLAGTAPAEVDGVVCLVDGGVYNLAEVAGGLGLAAETPAEVVLARGFRRWGAGLAPRLRGEFAILLWDRPRRRGLLVPDQLGVRRVVYRLVGRKVWFATEVNGLIALLPTRPAPDPAAVVAWLTARPAPGGATLYAGIRSLGPGELLELGDDGGRVRRYWQPTYREPLDLTGAELGERIREALDKAVARRDTPGAPLGVLMSGGLDSTSIAVIARERATAGSLAFSATFPDYPSIDESPWIDVMESEAGIEGLRLAARGQGILAGGLEYLDRWQLPLHAWSEAWTQPLLRRAAALGVTAMLSGEGGDELFGSRFLLTADLIRAGRLRAAFDFARGLPEAGGRAPRRVLARVLWGFGLTGVPSARTERTWRHLRLGDGRAPHWATGETARLLREARAPSWRASDAPRWWAHLTDALTEGVHGFGLLDHVRRRTEQAGLEARHPLLDLDLFELMLRVPPLLCSEGNLTRPLLREAMEGRTPDAVRLRPDKSVFDLLVTDALVGPELPALRELLGGGSEIRAFARAEAITDLLDHPPPSWPGDPGAWGDDVMRLTAMETWLRFQADPALPQRLLADPLVPKPSYSMSESPGLRSGGVARPVRGRKSTTGSRRLPT
ncbi:MAG TPA: asparagine synthase-related protein [Solirubrobacterales bacterium]|nr:asparagine synthase-related protein [Solirubrobacterales bacterium]